MGITSTPFFSGVDGGGSEEEVHGEFRVDNELHHDRVVIDGDYP